MVSKDTVPNSQVLLSPEGTLSQVDSSLGDTPQPEDNMRRLFAMLIGHNEYSTLTDEYVKLINEKGAVTVEYGAPKPYKVCYCCFCYVFMNVSTV